MSKIVKIVKQIVKMLVRSQMDVAPWWVEWDGFFCQGEGGSHRIIHSKSKKVCGVCFSVTKKISVKVRKSLKSLKNVAEKVRESQKSHFRKIILGIFWGHIDCASNISPIYRKFCNNICSFTNIYLGHDSLNAKGAQDTDVVRHRTFLWSR